MNEIDNLLDELKLKSPELRDKVKAELLGYALERGIVMLLEKKSLTEEEKATINEVARSGSFDDKRLEAIFSSPERQEVLAAALVESFELITAK